MGVQSTTPHYLLGISIGHPLDGAGSLGISDLLWALWTMLSKGLSRIVNELFTDCYKQVQDTSDC